MNIFRLLIALPFFSPTFASAQNLFDLRNWKVNYFDTFSHLGDDEDNALLYTEGPYGDKLVAWKTYGSFDDSWTGVNLDVNLDRSKSYRFCVWVKMEGETDGAFYFRLNNVPDDYLLNLKGSSHNEFYASSLTNGTLSKWLLYVGYLHSDSYYAGGIGAIYDGDTGKKVGELNDLKFSSTAPQNFVARNGLWLVTNPNRVGVHDVTLWFCSPRVEEINGNELPLSAMLRPNNAVIGENKSFFDDNVGIKTRDTKGYALAVNGIVRTKEIKVEADNWPDYVFKNDYQLMSLKDVEQHIRQHGHLPDIPKAQQVEEQGISLGEMNKLLMKKVEELTLHAIANEKSRIGIEQRIRQLETLLRAKE